MRVTLSSAGRGAVRVHVALAAQMLALTALVIFEETRGDRLAARIAAVGGDPRAPGAEEIMGEVTVLALLVLAVPAAWIAAATAYLRWLGGLRPRAVRAWLVPGVNLVAPPFALHAVWAAAGAADDGRRRRWLILLTGWWLSWLTALGVIVVSLLARDAGVTGLGPAAAATTALAAALCAATVREVTYGSRVRRGAGARPLFAPLGGSGAASAPTAATAPGKGRGRIASG